MSEKFSNGTKNPKQTNKQTNKTKTPFISKCRSYASLSRLLIWKIKTGRSLIIKATIIANTIPTPKTATLFFFDSFKEWYVPNQKMIYIVFGSVLQSLFESGDSLYEWNILQRYAKQQTSFNHLKSVRFIY